MATSIQKLPEGIITQVLEVPDDSKIIDFYLLDPYGDLIPIINGESLSKINDGTIALFRYVDKDVEGKKIIFAEIETTRRKPYKAVLVGIDNYSTSSLRGCVSSMEEFADLLETKPRYAGNIKKISNEFASKKNILRYLEHMIKNSVQGEKLIFFFSGHGKELDPERQINAICPYDEKNLIHEYELYDIVDQLNGAELFIILDTCFAAGLPAKKYFENIKSANTQMVWLLSSAPDNYSLTSPLSNGYCSIYTYSLLKALREAKAGTSLKNLNDAINQEIQSLGMTQLSELTGNQTLIDSPFL